MKDYPITQGEWTFLGPRTAVHENGSLIVHKERRYYRLEADAIEDRKQAERFREVSALLDEASKDMAEVGDA